MNIECLFSTPKRISILRDIVYRSGSVSVSETARSTKLSKGLVSKFLESLEEQRVLERSGMKYAVRSSAETRAIRIFLNLELIAGFPYESYPFIEGVGLFGSCAKGENLERSDIDLWILIPQANSEAQAELTGDLRRSLGDVRPLYLTREKLNLMKEREPAFYCSLLCGSISIWGVSIEAI